MVYAQDQKLSEEASAALISNIHKATVVIQSVQVSIKIFISDKSSGKPALVRKEIRQLLSYSP